MWPKREMVNSFMTRPFRDLYLVGISPGGTVTFISELFPGSISDKQLTLRSGLFELLEDGDSVMTDRGFDIQDYLTPLGIEVNIPSSLTDVAEQMFFVCAVLTNFFPPLC